MALNKEKIKELLGSGLDNVVVANAVGCTLPYLTELMSDPLFAGEVIELRSKALTSHTKRDREIDGIEDELISKLKDAISTDQIYKPRDILQAFAVLNAAKRRGVPAHASMTQINTVVQLNLPERLLKQFTITPQGEVIDVETDTGKQTLVTMPAHTLLEQLAKRDEGDGEKYREVAKYLPEAARKGV